MTSARWSDQRSPKGAAGIYLMSAKCLCTHLYDNDFAIRNCRCYSTNYYYLLTCTTAAVCRCRHIAY